MSVAQAADARNRGMLAWESSPHTVARETSRSVHHSSTAESAMPMELRQLSFSCYSFAACSTRSRSSSMALRLGGLPLFRISFRISTALSSAARPR